MPVTGSNAARRTSPESTTARTPGSVRLVSAMLVARTTRRRPAGSGSKARACSAGANSPYKGSSTTESSTSGMPPSIASVRRISPAPGKKASTSPAHSRNARCTASASSRSGDSSPPGKTGIARPTYRTATGYRRPAAVTTGTSAPVARESSADTAAPSSVADITTIRRSVSSVARASRHSASPVSACKLRSWNSSKSTAATPSSAGSDCSMRVSTPSVTTSMRVCGPTRVSSRMR